MRIIIRRHPRKTKRKLTYVRRHPRRIKKQGIMYPRDRKIFEILSSGEFKKETGGYLDFGKGKTGSLEKFDVATGNVESVTLPFDYEAVWHSHIPFKGKIIEVVGFPSEYDIVHLIKSPKIQASIIFHKGNAFSIIKTNISKKLNNISDNELLIRYKIDDEKEMIKKLKEDGFIIKKSKKGKRLVLPIKVI